MGGKLDNFCIKQGGCLIEQVSQKGGFMSRMLLVTLKKNINKRDIIFDCIYTPRSDVGDLLHDWLKYDATTGTHAGPLRIMIRDWVFFDKFQEDFSRIKDFCPRVASFDDVWTIQDLSTLKTIHTSVKEQNFIRTLFGDPKSRLDDFGDDFTSRDA